MKLKIDDDLINVINIANNGFKPSSVFIKNFIQPMGNYRFFNRVFNVMLITSLLTNNPLGIAILIGYYGGIYNIIKNNCENNNEIIKQLYDQVLKIYVNLLEVIEVNTTLSFLKEAQIIKTNYSIKYEDSVIPKLKQDRYIDIEQCNGYNKTLLQEHIVGSNVYELSVGNYTKEKTYRPSLIKSNS